MARRLLATAVSLVLAGVVVAGMIGGDASAEERARSIGAQIKCPVCQGVAIVDSPSETARAMMAVVDEKVADGWSDSQIVDYFADRYGSGIVIDPPLRGRTLVLWMLPVAALLAGAAMIWTRRRVAPAAAES
jgi:cytochrome c-type biogenesis protein CcmH